MHDFCRPNSDAYSGYIDYLDREETQRNHAIQTFNLFNDYMGNPEKSTGLFTNEKDNLTHSEKRELKDVFQTAQDNESVMWQTVISFDNRWLEQNGIYDSQKQILDEQKLKEVTRLAVNRLLKSEGLEHAVWSAGIHYNTDNLHVHIATVEPYPMREKMMYNGKKEVRGKFKLQNINNCKSAVVNEIMRTKDINLQINNIIRKDIIASAESRNFRDDPIIREQFLKLYENLQGLPKHKQNYNNHIMKPFREQIDGISEIYIQKYCKEEYKELTEILQRQSELYAEAYGGGNWDAFERSKKKDLYTRMGNFVLREIKAYEIGISNFEKTYLDEGNKAEIETIENLKEDTSLNELELSQQKESNIERLEVQEPRQVFEKAENILEKSLDFGNSSEPYMAYFREWKELQKQIDFTKEKNLADMLEKKYQNNPFVMHFIGEITMYGRGTEINLEASGNSYKNAFGGFLAMNRKLEGDPLSQYQIGKMLYTGKGCEQNTEKAISYLEKSAEGKNVSAQLLLSQIYIKYDMRENLPLAIKYLKELAEKGNNETAQYALGKLFVSDEELKDIDRGVEYLKAAEEKENRYAKILLGKLYLDLDSGIYDAEQGVKYLTELAEAGNAYACYYLGKEYVRKESLYYNAAKGVQHLEIAKDLGNDWAKYSLGKIYLDKTSSEYRANLGMQYMTELAESGNEYALVKLGFEYLKGENVERNIFSAYNYFSQAAAQGNQLAETMMQDLSTERTKRRLGNPLGELDKALMQLNRSFQAEMIQSMKNIREYNLEQEYVLDEISL